MSDDSKQEVVNTYEELFFAPSDDIIDYSPVVVTVGIEQTGLKFTLGKLLHPNSRDIDYCLTVLMDNDVLDNELLELKEFEVSMLFGTNSYEWRKRYIWRILDAMGVRHDPELGWQYPYLPDKMDRDDLRVLAAIWVLQCWDWNINRKRPEPRLPGVYNKGILHSRSTVPSMRCPICGKAMPERDIRTRLEVRLRKFRYWMQEHAHQYHHYSNTTHKKQYYPTRYPHTKKRSK